MSRRSRHGHHAHSHATGRPVHHAASVPERPATPTDGAAPVRPEPGVAAATAGQAVAAPAVRTTVPATPAAPVAHDAGRPEVPPPSHAPTLVAPPVPAPAAEAPSGPAPALMVADARPVMDADASAYRTTCTSAQLRRFIKSRPWVPLHELRRRFGISGDDDDVSPIRVAGQLLFVGLPPAEARMVGELLSGGDVGYELSLDPTAPIVVGVYPMRPVPRG